jgi:hypothetical protein
MFESVPENLIIKAALLAAAQIVGSTGETSTATPAIRSFPLRRSEHIDSNAWLCRECLGAEVKTEGQELVVRGIGFRARSS